MATGHTPPGASLWSKGAPHLRPHRGGGPSPTGHIRHRLPHWPEKRTAPIGKRGATPSPASHWPPTGHLRALYWPSGEASHWPKGRPRLDNGTGGGAYGHTGAPAPPLPGHLWPKGSRPLTGLPLAPHWPQRGGAGAPSPGPPPTDHLRTHSPHRPIEAFGREASPTPQTFGSGGLRDGEGVFACKGRMATGARAHRHTLGDPLRPTPLTD